MIQPQRYLKSKWLRLQRVHRAQYRYADFSEKQKSYLVWFIILLMTISQISIGIYLPSLPNMAALFKVSHTAMQSTLTLYLLGYGISQFFYGPLSDIYGRRWMILIGLLIFIGATIVCLISSTIHFFMAGRLLQGVGIGCGDTMGRAILCDQFKEQAFVKAACRIGLAATVMPLLAPVIGGYMEILLHWRANFVFILIYAIISLWLVSYYLPETKPRQFFGTKKIRYILNSYLFVLKNRIFLGFFIPGLVCFSGETLYSMISPFLIQQQLGWTPDAFGWLSLFIILGLLIGTFVANRLSSRISHDTMVMVGLIFLLAGSFIMLVPVFFGKMSVPLIIAPMVIFMAGVGIVYPNTNMGALTPFTAMAGTAGALQGGLQMVIGGAVASLVSALPNDTQFSLASSLTFLAVFGIILFHRLVKNQPKTPSIVDSSVVMPSS